MTKKLILGGPGCGKTTALLGIVEQAFSRGVEPNRVAFVAFTRKAATEARERMVKKFGVDEKDIPYFRTLHSFAFAHLDINRSQILDEFKLRDYAKAEGLDLSSMFIDEFGQAIPHPMTPDESALAAYSHSRLTGETFEDAACRFDVNPEFARRVRDDYIAFKQDAILCDFTDMIEQFRDAQIPTFDLLIVDEAQDLSALQWAMVDRLIDNAREVYFAGDDDQAIYAWAGADIEHFLSLDAEREVLPTSYRLKRNVFDACQKVIKLVDNRYPKDWEPHAEGGVVDFVSYIENVDLSEGSWYLLARTNSLVRKFTKYLRDEGFAYWSPTKDGMKSSIDVEPVRAVLVYENLRKGKMFAGEDMNLVWKHIAPKLRPSTAPAFDPLHEYSISDLCCTGFDASRSWLDALSISGGMQAYIRAMRARGESLIKSPRITASTIHGVKGGEADNVLISQQLTGRTHRSWVDGDPQEVRALFTAMSRARERLVFLNATSAISYQVERILT